VTYYIGAIIFTYIDGKKKGEKEEERIKLCISANVFDDEYTNMYKHNEKKNYKKKLIMRDAAKRTHVYVKRNRGFF